MLAETRENNLEPLNKRIDSKSPQGCLLGKGNWISYSKVRLDCKLNESGFESIRLLMSDSIRGQ